MTGRRLRGPVAGIVSWVLALTLGSFASGGVYNALPFPFSVPLAFASFVIVAASVVSTIQRDIFGVNTTRAHDGGSRARVTT
jgi:hypothetical protein